MEGVLEVAEVLGREDSLALEVVDVLESDDVVGAEDAEDVVV